MHDGRRFGFQALKRHPNLLVALKRRGEWFTKHPIHSMVFKRGGTVLCLYDLSDVKHPLDQEPVNLEDRDPYGDYARAINTLLDRNP